MSVFRFYGLPLLLSFLYQSNVSAGGGASEERTAGGVNCSPTIHKEFVKTMDLVREVTLWSNFTEIHLVQLRDVLGQTPLSKDAVYEFLQKHLYLDQQTLDSLLQLHEHLLKAETPTPEAASGCFGLEPRDCSDIRSMGFSTSGVYHIYMGADDRRMEADVYCDLSSDDESWLVFQRRKDGSVNFRKPYSEYERGFGNLSGEFWLGNQILSTLTMTRKYKLRVELGSFEGEKRYAEYSIFSVKPETDKYQLTVGGYSGNAGDSLSYHNGMKFSASDVDNDGRADSNCAAFYGGGWWYNACHQSNLNGHYFIGSHPRHAAGTSWLYWLGHNYSLKTTEMKIAAVD